MTTNTRVSTRRQRFSKNVALRRVLQIAASRFINERFEDVAITQIAKAANCSNSTMYDAFEDKDGLWAAAIRDAAVKLHIPQLGSDPSANPFEATVARLRTWFDFANDPLTRAMFVTIIGSYRAERVQAIGIGDPMDHWNAVKEDLRKSRDSGYLRDLDLDVMTQHAVGSLVSQLLLGHTLWTGQHIYNWSQQIRIALSPLLTEIGQKKLETILACEQQQVGS